MNVLHLISSGGMYGAESVILNLSHVLERQGTGSVIASFENANHQLHQRAGAEGLNSMLVPCNGQVSPATLQAIRALTKERSIDVLHAHGYKADLYAWAALRASRVALVSTCHTWYDNDFAVRVYGALDRRILRSFGRVVAVSADVERRLLDSGVPAGKIRKIRNGIDVHPFAPIANERPTRDSQRLRVGLVGRLSREKGVDVFIDAAARVSQVLPDAEFVVIGEGPDRAQLEEQIRVRKLVDRMHLLGHRESMLPVYAELDLLVSASRHEGLPIALLEGMASGLPLVATTVGEVPRLVVPGETGLLVTPGDAVALAEAMLQLLQRDDQRIVFGRNASERIQREYSADRMAAEYQAVYHDAVEQVRERA